MQKTRLMKTLSIIVCVVLTAAMALCMSGCSDNNTTAPTDHGTVTTTMAAPTDNETDSGNVKGEGATVFTFEVEQADGTKATYEVHTDKTTVGDALVELGLIAGEESTYGLYVKTVDGVTLDYDKDGKYWAFYVGGEYAMSGVDTTTITAGETYTFKAEKG